MKNRKLIISFSVIAGVVAVGSLIGVGYTTNKVANRYQAYGKAPISSSNTDLIQTYFASAVNGSKLLYLASFSHTSPLVDALNISASENPTMNKYLGDIGYILIDDAYGIPSFKKPTLNDKGEIIVEGGGLTSFNQPLWSTNVASVQFRSDLGSFITGIAAGQFLNENKEYFTADDGKLKWATYGGGPYGSVTPFMGGFQRGVDWFNKNVASNNPDFMELEQIILGSGISQNFTSSFNPESVKELLPQFFKENADLIFPIAGPQIGELVRWVRQYQKRTVILGVDSAVEEDTSVNLDLPIIPNGTTIGTNKVVPFSSVKNLDELSSKVTQIINKPEILEQNSNNPEWESIGGLGFSSLGSVNNNGVGVSAQGYQYFNRAMETFAKANNVSLTLTGNDSNDYASSVAILSQQQAFKDLDKTENKYYSVLKDGGLSSIGTWKYEGLSNNGIPMVPIAGTDADVENWYDQYYDPIDPYKVQYRDKNIVDLKEWISRNTKATNGIGGIENRKNVASSLKNQFTKDSYNQNNGIIKIIFQSSTSILFDKSFLESCYIGLYKFWESEGVSIPLPPGK